ncbi:MAG: hypothetical protein IKY75_07545 [Bacteroidaceae bacterium]|nr:hypothetical protein [Bacteroidaceae bacterium]
MKKFVSIALLICATITVVAREYEPTEGWPYLFKDFKPAIVYYQDGKAESANINVHLIKNDLHFTDNEKIMLVHDGNKIDSVVCEDHTVLIHRANLYVTCLHKTDYVVIGTTSQCDFNALNDGDGAYGIPTTTASTQSIASFNDHGNMAALRYKEMTQNKYNTRTLPTINRTVMVVNDRALCHANKRGVSDLLTSEQKKAFNKYIKENKIKWKDINSLILVAMFLDEYVKADALLL